jgi:hypothetical protein
LSLFKIIKHHAPKERRGTVFGSPPEKSMTEKQNPNLTIIHPEPIATDLHTTQTHAKQHKTINRHKILTMIVNVTKRISPDTTIPTSSQGSFEDANEVFTMRDKGKSMVIDGIGGGWKIKGRIDSLGGRAILQETGRIMAVVIRERSGLRVEYKILGTVPSYQGQKEHNMRIKGRHLYVHATIRCTNHFSNNFLIRRLDEDVEYEVQGHSRFGPTLLKICDKESKQYCGSVRQFFEDDNVCLSKWQVRIRKGTNPNIMICLTAIVNKSMGGEA